MQQAIRDAVADWESRSCVTFPERTTETHYIEIQNGGGCSSYIGNVDFFLSPQPMSLAFTGVSNPGCVNVSYLTTTIISNVLIY